MVLRSFLDGALFGEIYGEGPPQVLALHGWGRRGADFRQSLEGLSALALDLPGFGASPAPSDVIGAEGYADIVAKILTEFKDPPLVVAHSFGGRIAVCLGARMPDVVGPLVLTGVPVIRTRAPQKPSMSLRMMRSLNKISLVSDEKMEKARRKRGSADYLAARGVMRDILVKIVNESYEQQLRSLESQVDLLWGSEDREVPVSVARIAVDVIGETGGNARLRILDGVGHHVPTQAPQELRRTIDLALT